MPRVLHFEIGADDPQRAIKFYQQSFGWEVEKWEGPTDYWLVMTGKEGEPGIDGAITKREREGAWGTVNTVDVPSVDEYAERVVKAGGKIEVPKQAIPGVGYWVYCVDTEGNSFGMMERDESAQ